MDIEVTCSASGGQSVATTAVMTSRARVSLHGTVWAVVSSSASSLSTVTGRTYTLIDSGNIITS